MPAVACVILAGACGFLALAFALAAPFDVLVPWFGPGTAFALDSGQAGVLAAVLLSGAGCLLAARTGGPAIVGLILATIGAVLAQNDYTLIFATLLAGLIVFRFRAVEPCALAALPAVLLALALYAIPPDGSILAIVPGAVMLIGAGWAGAITLDLARIARAVACGFIGMALVGLGLGAPAAARLCIETGLLIAPPLGLAALELDGSTGTRSLDWLGGLARGMPRFSFLLLAGFGFTSLLPPGAGFAAFRVVLDRAFVVGGWGGGVAGAALATGFALFGFGAIRGFGLACLGRPRSLRAAAAEDPGLSVLLALSLPLAGALGLAITAEPLPTVGLLVIGFLVRRFAIRSGPIDVTPFESGFAKPPAWLPFGDPATQITATGFAAGLRLPTDSRHLRNGLTLLHRVIRP